MIRFIQQAIRSAGTALRRKAGGADQSVEDFILSVGTEYEPAPLPTPPMANQGWWGQRLEYVKTPPSYVFNDTLWDYDYANNLSIAKPTVSDRLPAGARLPAKFCLSFSPTQQT